MLIGRWRAFAPLVYNDNGDKYKDKDEGRGHLDRESKDREYGVRDLEVDGNKIPPPLKKRKI